MRAAGFKSHEQDWMLAKLYLFQTPIWKEPVGRAWKVGNRSDKLSELWRLFCQPAACHIQSWPVKYLNLQLSMLITWLHRIAPDCDYCDTHHVRYYCVNPCQCWTKFLPVAESSEKALNVVFLVLLFHYRQCIWEFESECGQTYIFKVNPWF